MTGTQRSDQIWVREFFGQLRLWGHIHIEKNILHHEHELAQLTTAQRMRMAMEELGRPLLAGTVAAPPDILPRNYIIELEKLQYQVSRILPRPLRKS
jgi:predicted unusual protein kinase regulating ubiquinone biosynthesis (AarF/ABC1/UbiB family)